MSAPDAVPVEVEDFDESNPDHVALTQQGEVCAWSNEDNESTADLSGVVTNGSQG